MALTLSARAELLSKRRNVQPNLILEIDGISTIYATIDTLKPASYGDDGLIYGMVDLYYGGGIVDPNIKSLISTDSSGTSLRQQIAQDKGSVSSVTSMPIELIDYNGEASNLVSPGFAVTELLSRKARVYVNFKDGFHPNDSVLIHKGIIDNIEPGTVSVKLTVASPESQKRQELFFKQTTQLSGAINNSQTTITVDSTDNFIVQSLPELESYIKIGDEIIQWTSKDDLNFFGCTRGALGTTTTSHADNDEVETFYRLQDNAIDLALKLMLSGGGVYGSDEIQGLGGTDPLNLDPNIIFFNHYDIQFKRGLVVGDLVTVSGSAIVGNNQSNLVITGFGKNDIGSWIEVNATFTVEFGAGATASFQSKYDVLSTGMKMTPEDVDVAEHEDISLRFSNGIPDYDFYIKDTIKCDEFLAQEIYYPAGLYSIPRKAKSSVGIIMPPIADDEIVTLNEENVVNPTQLKSQRSLNKNFYNAITYKYDELPLEEKYLAGKVTVSADAISRFSNIGSKPLSIVSKGLRTGGATDTIVRLNSRRLLERYQFASEFIPSVKVLFTDAFKIEVGDIVVFGSPELKMTDLTTGDRNTQEKLYEVVNKTLNLKNGEATVDLLATNFELDGRYGVISPSSIVDAGSSTTEIKIRDSFSTTSPSIEKTKWMPYIGEKIYVHSTDYTVGEEVTLTGFSTSDDYKMQVDPALSFTPSSGYIVDIPYYPTSTDATVNAKYKLLHCFFDPQIPIVSGTSSVEFDVSISDAAKIFVGSIILVHDEGYTTVSPEVVVTNITGTTITVDQSLTFTPNGGGIEFVELVGFKDEGLPYRII